jgi:hypothetical protein
VGFMDKVKEQAAAASAKAQDAAQKGQAKLDTMQTKKTSDAMLRDLGVAVYAEQTGRADASTQVTADRIIGALQQHEATHGPITLAFESPASADPTLGVPTSTDAGTAASVASAPAPGPAAAPVAPAAPASAPPTGVPTGVPMSAPVDSPPPTGQPV